jgi:hypothetical protein
MSQSVQLDMEVLQRIKFLMEYDVMKTSCENILLEQSTDLQKLAKEKGFGPVSLSKAQELYSQGKLGNLPSDPISGQAKVLADRKDQKDKEALKKFEKLPDISDDILHPKSAKWGDVPNVTLETVTQDVRKFMSDWKTATAETLATIFGVGIPITVAANGFWLTLEVIQAVKGNPDYLSLVFAFIATATAGSQSVILKPLYSVAGKILKGGGGKSVVDVFDAIYEAANKLGLWDKLKPILEGIKIFSKATIDEVTKGLKWLNDNVLWIFKGATWLGKETGKGIMGILSPIKTFISGLFNTMDNWLANIGTRAGLKPQAAQQIGKATRWGAVPFATHKGMQLYNQSNDTTPILTTQQMDSLPYDAEKWKF